MELRDIPLLRMDEHPTLATILEQPVRVSTRSLFIDDDWFLDGWTPGHHDKRFAIRWNVVADRSLIDGLKLLAALLFLERDGRRIYNYGTAGTFSAGARHLLRFMTAYGYSGFDQLDSHAIDLFRRNLHTALSDPEKVVEESDDEGTEEVEDVHTLDGEPTRSKRQQRKTPLRKQIGKHEFTYPAAYNRLRMLQLLWDRRAELAEAGVSPPAEDPFPGSSAAPQAEAASAIAWQLIPPLPDEVANAIMSDAFRMIGSPADDVLALISLFLAPVRDMGRASPAYERAQQRKALERFEFAHVDGRPWRQPLDLGPRRAGGSLVINELVDLIREACVAVIFSGTGCRMSEVLSLETGGEPRALPAFARRQREEPLPSCISTARSKSGLHQLFYMHGKLSKGQPEPKDEKWLIGSRPMDRREGELPVIRAIRVLERLFLPWRHLVADEDRQCLILNFTSSGVPHSARGIAAAEGWRLNEAMKRYYARPEVGLARLASSVRSDPKLASYVRDKGANIRPHQWRKTFALYMMRLDERMLPALANHFKHVSIAVTEGAYMPQDPSMIAAGESVQMRETHRALYEARRGAGGRFGKLDRAMDAFHADLQKLIGDLPLEENFEGVRRALLQSDIRIFHSEHGRCLIAANPDRARCHEAGGTSSWRRLTPNAETRTPRLCVGCDNFSVSAEHGDFWLRRYLENRAAWLLNEGSADFEVVRRRAEQAETVLKALTIPRPDVNTASAALFMNLQRAQSGSPPPLAH